MSIDTIRSKNSLDKLLGAVNQEKARNSEKKSYVSQIYRFEELNESWKDIERRVQTGIELNVYDRNYKDDYKRDYTDYSYNLISTQRAKDIALFGYNFDGYEGEVPLQFETDFVGDNYAYTYS